MFPSTCWSQTLGSVTDHAKPTGETEVIKLAEQGAAPCDRVSLYLKGGIRRMLMGARGMEVKSALLGTGDK